MTAQTQLSKEKLASLENASPMTDTQIEALKLQIFNWNVVEDVQSVPHLHRAFKFDDFANTLHFTTLVGELAEDANHHPRITLEWGRAAVEWWSHEVSGLHRNDFIMAARVNEIYDRWAEITGEKDKLQQALEDTFPASDPRPVGSRIE